MAERADAPPAAAEVPSTDTRRITESPEGRPIDVTVLEVRTGGPAGASITDQVTTAVDALITEWDEVVGPPSEQSADQPDPELQLAVSAARVDDRYVSVALDGFRYLGGASGDAVSDAWTFATASGEHLSLADVGLDGACLDELGSLAADALVAQGVGMFDEAETELRAGRISLERWSLTDEHLRIHFPEYEVAPGAAGAPVAQVDLGDVHTATGSPLGAQ